MGFNLAFKGLSVLACLEDLQFLRFQVFWYVTIDY